MSPYGQLRLARPGRRGCDKFLSPIRTAIRRFLNDHLNDAYSRRGAIGDHDMVCVVWVNGDRGVSTSRPVLPKLSGVFGS